MKKKALIFITLFTLCLLLAYSSAFGIDASPEVLDLKSLETQLLSKNAEIRQALERTQIADYKQNAAEDEKGMVVPDFIESQKNQKYYIEEAEMNVAYTRWLLKEKKEEIILEGKKIYFDWLLLQKEILLQENKIKRLLDQSAELEKEIDLGLEIETAQGKLQLAIDNEGLALKALQNRKAALELDYNALLGRNMNAPVALKEEPIPFERYSVTNLDAKIQEVHESNGELIHLDELGDLLLIELNIYQSHNSNQAYNKKIITVKEAITQNGFDYNDLKLKLEYDIRMGYNALQNAYDNCTIQELIVKSLTLDLEQLDQRLKVGLITEDAVTALAEQLSFEKLKFEKQKLSYFIAVESFKNLLQ